MVVERGGPACGSRAFRMRSRPSITTTGPGALTATSARRHHALPSLYPVLTPSPPAQPSAAGTHLRALITENGPGAGAYQCWYQLKASPLSPVSLRSGATLMPASRAAPNQVTVEQIGMPLPKVAS